MVATVLLLLCAAAIAHILIGHPFYVYLQSKRAGRPVRKTPVEKTVTAIIPVHNGAHYLEKKLDSLLALDYPRELLDVIVIADGCTDNTAEVVRRYEGRRVRLLELPRGGKCLALNAGIAEASGEILFLTDVRQTMEPPTLRYLLESYADETVGAVSGELVVMASDGRAESDIGAYRRFECWLRDSLARIDSMLGATGAIYTMRRELAVPLPADTLLDDMYLPLKGAFFRGYRLIMERRAKAYDPPMPLDTEFGRKVRTLAGNYQLLQSMPELLGSRNRMWFHYVSYKVGRLILPWLLVAFFLLSLFVPWPWNAILVALQVCAYGLALADPILPERSPMRRVTSPAHSFLVMMWAAMLAVKIFFVLPQDLWKVTGARSPQPSGQGR